MPMIHIEYNNEVLSDDQVLKVSNAIQKIVSEKTGIKDVFVYANSAHIKVQVAPLEVFISMSKSKIVDLEVLFEDIKNTLSVWKTESDFTIPINLTIIPMDWKFETNI